MYLFFNTLLYIFFVCIEGTIESKRENSNTIIKNSPILIIISYDGFRNEYLQRGVTPNLLKFRKDGVYADYMLNVFPTKTFTNHHSISTGYYSGYHGVLANSLFDLEQGPLNYSSELFHYNPDILPIWSLNEKSGGVSGCMMWPGSNFEYSGISCTHTTVYDSKIPLDKRVDTMMSWLTHPEKPANLVMFYSEEPDKLAHAIGPESQNITNMVKKLDSISNYIQIQLKRYNLTNRANVIHLSDHGMASVSPPKFINLTQYLVPGTYEIYGTSPVLQVVPVKDKEEEIFITLLSLSKTIGNFAVYNNSNIKERWHSKNKRRFGPIVIVANIGYAFQDMWKAANYYKDKFNLSITDNSMYGIHGYDNMEESMHPIFMAKGPIFKADHKVEPFETVDLFQLFIKILGINEISKRNGTITRIEDVLIHKESGSNTHFFVIMCLGLIVLALGTYVFYYKRRRRHSFSIIS